MWFINDTKLAQMEVKILWWRGSPQEITSLNLYLHLSSVNFVCNAQLEVAPKKITIRCYHLFQAALSLFLYQKIPE